MEIPSGLEFYIDTNYFLYYITEHPKYINWCENFFDRINAGELKGVISIVVLNELLHKLIIGEIAETKNINTFSVIKYIKKTQKF